VRSYEAALCDAAIEGLGPAAPTTTFLTLDKHGHEQPRITMAGNSLHDPEFYSSSEAALAESRAAGCICPENSRFCRKLIFNLNIQNSLQALVSHAAAIVSTQSIPQSPYDAEKWAGMWGTNTSSGLRPSNRINRSLSPL
jgi:hypothetical protein